MDAMNEQLDGCRIKGGIIRAHLDFIRQKNGDDAVKDVLKRLPPATANEIRSALSATWVAFESLVLLDRAIVAFSGGTVTMRDLGRFSAQQNLSTTYRAFKRSDIHDFFRRSAALHGQFQDFGVEEYVPIGERAGRIVHRDYRCFTADYCESARGYYEAVMEMHGGERPAAAHPQCVARGAAECVFELRW